MQPKGMKNFMEKDKLKRYLLIAGIVFAVFFLSITYFFMLYRNQDTGELISTIVAVLRPLIIGAILAYIMKSTCNFFEKSLLKLLTKLGKQNDARLMKNVGVAAVILTYITWIAMIAILLIIAIPQIVQSVTDFTSLLIVKIPEYTDFLIKWEREFLADQEMLRPYFDKLVVGLQEWANTDLIPWIQTAVTGMIPKLLSVATSMVDIVVGVVISVFILSGRKMLARKSVMLLHCIFQKDKSVNAIVDEFKYADKMFSGFLEGKVMDSAIIGLIYYIALEIMNVPYPALVAVICGVTNIIPIFGPFIGAIPSGFIILTADPIKVIPFIIFVCVIQFVDGYIIDPHIVGGNIKMSSFCVIFAVMTFGGLWGFMGLLVGVPTFAVIYDIFRKLSLYILKKRGKQHIIDKFRLELKEEKVPSPPKKSSFSLGGKKKKASPESPAKAEEVKAADTVKVCQASDSASENKEN